MKTWHTFLVTQRNQAGTLIWAATSLLDAFIVLEGVMQLPVVGKSASVDLPEVDPAHDLQGVPMVAVRGVTNTFQVGFQACSTEGDPYLVLNQMPRSGQAIATLILPNRTTVKLPSKYLIFV